MKKRGMVNSKTPFREERDAMHRGRGSKKGKSIIKVGGLRDTPLWQMGSFFGRGVKIDGEDGTPLGGGVRVGQEKKKKPELLLSRLRKTREVHTLLRLISE